MGIMGDILDVTADGGRDGIIVSAISKSQPISLCSVRQMWETDRSWLGRISQKW